MNAAALQEEIDRRVHAALSQLAAQAGYRTYDGTHCDALTKELSQRFAGADVLLASSGTAAVEIALRASGVGPGDEVLLSGYDYPGNFWAIERTGARPVLVDTEPSSWRICFDSLNEVAGTKRDGRIKAIIVSHLHGQLQDIEALGDWCREREIVLIEDACQAVTADFEGRPAGTIGHFGIISFGGGKVLSAGRGGAVITRDSRLSQQARLAAGAGSGPYALSELQAVVVRTQLPYVDEVTALSREYFKALFAGIAESGAYHVPYLHKVEQASFYQAGILVRSTLECSEEAGESSALLADLSQALARMNVRSGQGFAGFHRRTLRRCSPLKPRSGGRRSATSEVVPQTFTIHFSAAMQSTANPDQLAELMRNWSSKNFTKS